MGRASETQSQKEEGNDKDAEKTKRRLEKREESQQNQKLVSLKRSATLAKP